MHFICWGGAEPLPKLHPYRLTHFANITNSAHETPVYPRCKLPQRGLGRMMAEIEFSAF